MLSVCCAKRLLMLQIMSQSHCPLLTTSHPCRSFHPCLTIMITSSGAILSLPALPRERFAKVAQPRCTNTVPVARPFAVGIARRPAKHVSRRGPDGGGTKTKWRGLCGPKSVIENQKRTEAWELIWRSPDDGSGFSKYRRWNAWLREDMEESTSGIADTSSRTHRAVERSSRRAPVTVRSIKTPPRKLSLPDVAGGTGRSIVPTVRSSQSTGKGVQRGSEGTKKTSNGTALHVSVRGVRQWPDDGNSRIDRAGRGRDGVAARVSQEAHLSTGRGSFSRDVEHSRDPPERETSTHSCTVQDVRTRSCSPRGCTQHHQTGTHPAQSSFIHRKGIEQEGPAPPTNNERKIQSQLEQRRKRAEGKYA